MVYWQSSKIDLMKKAPAWATMKGVAGKRGSPFLGSTTSYAGAAGLKTWARTVDGRNRHDRRLKGSDECK